METSEQPAGLHFYYVPATNHYVRDTNAQQTALATILLDDQCKGAGPQISTGLRPLDTSLTTEIFTSDTPFISGHCAQHYWAQSDSLLLVAYSANEAEAGGLQVATQGIYDKLLGDIKERGYPHLVRVWNYFADINRIDQNLERYRQFCIGRFDSFKTHGLDEAQFPSACALGHHGGELLVYALASKNPVRHFENPQQASAYHYPEQYGPRSPSFARASLLEVPGQASKVFVSGTASVIGHATQHPDDLQQQIQVTLDNLERLIAHIAKGCDRSKGAMRAEILKVYVRKPDDVSTIRARITQAYPSVPAVYVEADICRADLLLEVDGVWQLVT